MLSRAMGIAAPERSFQHLFAIWSNRIIPDALLQEIVSPLPLIGLECQVEREGGRERETYKGREREKRKREKKKERKKGKSQKVIITMKKRKLKTRSRLTIFLL